MRGFFTLAEGKTYVKMAEKLAESLMQQNEKISIAVNDINDVGRLELFDRIIQINPDKPFYNECLVYELTPYEETIKLDADMFFPRKIQWWSDLSKFDLLVCTTIRNHRNEIIKEPWYRNHGNAYSALTYFKRSTLAEHFFKDLTKIRDSWNPVETLEDQFTTDTGYSILWNQSSPSWFSFVHLRRELIKDRMNWDGTRFCDYEQMYPVHIQEKTLYGDL